MASISGVTKQNGSVSQCEIRLYDHDTGELESTILSDNTSGEYTFDNIEIKNYDLVCIGNSSVCPQISGPILPSNTPFNYSLYLDSTQGEVWLATDTHYSDNSRLIESEVDDEIASLSGETGTYNSNQTNSSKRPILRDNSGIRYIEFDGIDDCMVIDGGVSNWNFFHNSEVEAYMIFALNINDSNNVLNNIIGNNNLTAANVGICIFRDDRISASHEDKMRIIVGKGSTPSITDSLSSNDDITTATDFIFEFVRSGLNFEIFLNSISIISGVYSTTTESNASNEMFLFNTPSEGFPTAGKLYGFMMCNKLPNTSERNLILSDMSNRCIAPPL